MQTELEQEIDTRVQELAHRFIEQHLNHDQSLFNEETFEITIQTLKYALDDVDKHTAYKDDDYWRLYEAIELFLYGELDMEEPHEDGTYWGINNFSSVWEDMCNTYAFEKFGYDNIIYADTNIIFKGERVANTKSAGFFPIYKKPDFNDPFFINFRGKQRWMRPDLIYEINLDINKSNDNDWIFNGDIKMVITKDSGARIDFKVKLLNKNDDYIYKSFCANLKNTKTHGIRFIGDNDFRNYSKLEVEEKKKIIKDKYESIVGKSPVIRLLDWKYMSDDCFINENKKIKTDITKQLCYEFSLQKSKPNKSIEIQFVIPWCYSQAEKLEEDIGDVIDDKSLHSRLQNNEIQVFKANFSKIQAIYLNHD